MTSQMPTAEIKTKMTFTGSNKAADKLKVPTDEIKGQLAMIKDQSHRHDARKP